MRCVGKKGVWRGVSVICSSTHSSVDTSLALPLHNVWAAALWSQGRQVVGLLDSPLSPYLLLLSALLPWPPYPCLDRRLSEGCLYSAFLYRSCMGSFAFAYHSVFLPGAPSKDSAIALRSVRGGDDCYFPIYLSFLIDRAGTVRAW